MKVILDKKAFTIDDEGLIKAFKMDWATPTTDDIKTALNVVACCLNIVDPTLIVVREIELTQNRLTPTYWVTVLVKGFDVKNNELYAEIGFDYKQAILSCSGDWIDNFTQIYKKV